MFGRRLAELREAWEAEREARTAERAALSRLAVWRTVTARRRGWRCRRCPGLPRRNLAARGRRCSRAWSDRGPPDTRTAAHCQAATSKAQTMLVPLTLLRDPSPAGMNPKRFSAERDY